MIDPPCPKTISSWATSTWSRIAGIQGLRRHKGQFYDRVSWLRYPCRRALVSLACRAAIAGRSGKRRDEASRQCSSAAASSRCPPMSTPMEGSDHFPVWMELTDGRAIAVDAAMALFSNLRNRQRTWRQHCLGHAAPWWACEAVNPSTARDGKLSSAALTMQDCRRRHLNAQRFRIRLPNRSRCDTLTHEASPPVVAVQPVGDSSGHA